MFKRTKSLSEIMYSITKAQEDLKEYLDDVEAKRDKAVKEIHRQIDVSNDYRIKIEKGKKAMQLVNALLIGEKDSNPC